MNIRERFEEIWPVPHGVYWNEDQGYCGEFTRIDIYFKAIEWDARLDTFTRCQETTFSKEELNLFRQWFNAVEDVSHAYLEKSDCDLYRKVMEMMK